MKYRADIDGLRTLAVVPVVLFHANVPGITGGFVGVDVFFVISGYLITTILRDELAAGDFSVLRFYERRARRILPALFAVMAATLAAGWFLLTPRDYADLAESSLAALLFMSNLWFWQNSGGYFAGPADYLPMLHTWSLAVEEQYYIFFPPILMLIWRWRQRLVLPLLVVVVLASLALSVWATPRMPSAAFYLLPTRIWELGFGALLALGLLPAWQSRGPLREALAAAGLVAALLPVVLFDRDTPFPGIAAALPVTGAALLIWTGGADGPTWAARLLALRPMVAVGLISYSLYLWHWPVMALLRERLFTVHLDPVWQVATVTVAFALAWASWRFIERPFRRPAGSGPASKAAVRTRVFAASAAGMAVLGAVAGAIMLTQGAQMRFTPAEVAALADFEFDPQVLACRQRIKPDNLCVFGTPQDKATGIWLLWGDSHAEAALPALIELARQNDKALVVAAMPACAPLPGVTRLDQPPARRAECQNFLISIEQHILQSARYERIWLHARWPLYVEGMRYGLEENTIITLAPAEAGTTVGFSPTGNLSFIRAALGELLVRLKAQGITVSLIGSVPEIPWDVAQRMQAQALYGVEMPSDPAREIIELRQGRAETLLSELAQKTETDWVPITPELCQAHCPTHVGLSAFYRDTNHLTHDGALHLLLPILAKAKADAGVRE